MNEEPNYAQNFGILFVILALIVGFFLGQFFYNPQEEYRELANAGFDAGFSSGVIFEACDAAKGFADLDIDCRNLSKLAACGWGVSNYLDICQGELQEIEK